MSMRAGALALVGLSLVLAGCDPSRQLAIHNMTSQALIVRVTDTTYADESGEKVSTFEVAPGVLGNAFPQEIGQLEGAVEVFDADCTSLGTIPARGGSVVLIAKDLSVDIRYLESADYEPEIQQLPRSGLCRSN